MGLFSGIRKAFDGAAKAVSSALRGSKPKPKRTPPKPSSSRKPSRSPSRSSSKSKVRSSKPGSVSLGGFSFSLPKVSLPKVQLPKVNLPKVQLPKVSLPKIPTFKTPKVHLPTLAAAAAVPSLAVPLAVGSSLPQISMPKIPTFKTPDISLPKISLPTLPDLSRVSGTASSGVDSIVGARDQAYDQGGADIGAGNVAKGGTEFAGAAAADILLPLDLADVTNKAMTGRMDEISGEDALWAGVDAVSLLAIPFTGGASYALARAAKGGKVLSSTAKVGKSMSLASGLKSAFKGIKGTGSAKGLKSYSSLARTAPRTSRAYNSAATVLKSRAPHRVLRKTPLPKTPNWKFGGKIPTKKSTKYTQSFSKPANTMKAADGVHASKAGESLKVAESTTALGHTGKAAAKSGLWWKVGAAGLGASVLSSFLMGDGAAGTPDDIPDDPYIDPYYPGGYPGGYPAQEDHSDDEYISELEAYIAELENALAAGQITPEEYEEFVGEAEAEMQDTAGEYFDSPFGEWIAPAEEMAQDVTRVTDGVPLVEDAMGWFRKHGLALPVLLILGGGGAYLVLTKTKTGKKVLQKVKGKGRK